MNDDTLEVPLPEGVGRSPDLTTTQELPVVKPFPEIRLVTPVNVRLPSDTRTVHVQTVPVHLLGDPILTMPAPVADETPLSEQLGRGRPEEPPEPKPRRKLVTADKFLIGMGVTALAMGVGVYGMVVNGWGAGDIPEEKAASAPRTPSKSPGDTREPEEPVLPTTGPQKTHEPLKDAVPVAAPQKYTPTPERSITVVAPTPTRQTPVAEEPVEAPAPAPTSSAPPRPSQTPAPDPVTSSPAPSTSAPETTPPVTQSQITEPTEQPSG